MIYLQLNSILKGFKNRLALFEREAEFNLGKSFKKSRNKNKGFKLPELKNLNDTIRNFIKSDIERFFKRIIFNLKTSYLLKILLVLHYLLCRDLKDFNVII